MNIDPPAQPNDSEFFYLATVYTRHPEGPIVAWMQACECAAALMKMGFNIFCPIAMSHPIAVFGELNAVDHDLWMKQDKPLMAAAAGMIVVRMPGWEDSEGIAEEIRTFEEAGKPIIFIDP